jgi:hypothetical protein
LEWNANVDDGVGRQRQTGYLGESGMGKSLHWLTGNRFGTQHSNGIVEMIIKPA